MAGFSIYFATDIHGSEHCFRKFLNAGKFYGVDAVILGGDIAGKGLVPIVEGPDGTWDVTFFGKPVHLEDEEQVKDLERRLRTQGLYAYRTTPDEVEQIAKDDEHLDRAFERVIGESVEQWVTMADQRLRDAGLACLVMPGNDDPPMVKRYLAEASWMVQAEERVVEFGPYQVISLGYSTPTPWNSPREITEEDMRSKLKDLIGKLDSERLTIFNLHNPPYDTTVDRAFKLTGDMRIQTAGGEPVRAPVGSHAVREAIEEVQPFLALHGHIHESRGTTKIGRTFVCNPGSLYTEGTLQGVLLTLDKERVKSQKFVSG